jgi:hypothetical protein
MQCVLGMVAGIKSWSDPLILTAFNRVISEIVLGIQ